MSFKSRTLILFLLLSIQSFSQINIEKLMTKRLLSCDDILVNNAELLPVYYRQKSMDTLSAFVDYWKKECGPDEFFPTTITTLLSIQNNNSLNDAPKNVLSELSFYMMYKYIFDDKYTYHLENKRFYGKDRLLLKKAALFDLIKLWATDLLKKPDLTKEQEFVLNVYNGKIDNLERLKTPPYNTTNLAKTYMAYPKSPDCKKNYYTNLLSVYSGLWMPTGKLGRLGNHPVLGFRYGVRSLKLIMELDFRVAFLKSKNKYLVLNDNTHNLEETTYFSDAYMGAHFGYRLINRNNHFLHLTAGAGYELLSTIKPSGNNDKNKPLSSFNFNAGMAYTYRFYNRSYISLEAKYNFVNFKNTGGSNLSGDYISLNLIYGFVANWVRRY